MKVIIVFKENGIEFDYSINVKSVFEADKRAKELEKQYGWEYMYIK